jgi:hypothetical protein
MLFCTQLQGALLISCGWVAVEVCSGQPVLLTMAPGRGKMLLITL